ncbi:lipopolysaccharide biosynthesis protein, partial [Planctomycetota bacterium]
NFVYAFSQWGVLIVVTRSSNQSDLGVFVFSLSITTPMMLLFGVGLRPALATDAANEFDFHHYLYLRGVASVLYVGCISVLSIGFWADIAATVIVVACTKAVESISEVIHGGLQRIERMQMIAVSLIARSTAVITLVTLFGFRTTDLMMICSANLAACLIVLAFFDASLLASLDSRWKINWKIIAKLLVRCAPIGVVTCLLSLNTYIPRYFVAEAIGRHALGSFGAISYLTLIGGKVVTALGQVGAPALSRSYCLRDLRLFRRQLTKMITLACCLGISTVAIALVFGETLLRFLYSDEVAADASLLSLLAGGAAISYVGSFIGYGVTATRQFKVQPWLMIFVIACNAAMCTILIPQFGVHGAGIAICGANILQAALYGIIMMQAVGRRK